MRSKASKAQGRSKGAGVEEKVVLVGERLHLYQRFRPSSWMGVRRAVSRPAEFLSHQNHLERFGRGRRWRRLSAMEVAQ